MISWMLFWKILLGGALLLFAGLAVVVTIFGFRDIITMFRRVDQQHEAGEERDSGPES